MNSHLVYPNIPIPFYILFVYSYLLRALVSIFFPTKNLAGQKPTLSRNHQLCKTRSEDKQISTLKMDVIWVEVKYIEDQKKVIIECGRFWLKNISIFQSRIGPQIDQGKRCSFCWCKFNKKGVQIMTTSFSLITSLPLNPPNEKPQAEPPFYRLCCKWTQSNGLLAAKRTCTT